MPTPQQKMTLLGKKLFELKRERDKAKAMEAKINAEIERISTGPLIELMADADVEKFTIKGFGVIYTHDEFYCTVKKAYRQELHEWLRATGNEELITDYVQPSTLKAFIKDRMARGSTADIPEYIEARHVPTAATMTTAKRARSNDSDGVG